MKNFLEYLPAEIAVGIVNDRDFKWFDINCYTKSIDGSGLTHFTDNPYNEQSSGDQASIVSGNVNDIDGGSGANKALVSFIRGDGTSGSEEVAMNGATAVNMAETNLRHVNKLSISKVGSNGSNQGKISLFSKPNAGTPKICSIDAGENRLQAAHYYNNSTQLIFVSSFLFQSEVDCELAIDRSQSHNGIDIVTKRIHFFVKAGIPFNAENLCLDIPKSGNFKVLVDDRGATDKLFSLCLGGWVSVNP